MNPLQEAVADVCGSFLKPSQKAIVDRIARACGSNFFLDRGWIRHKTKVDRRGYKCCPLLAATWFYWLRDCRNWSSAGRRREHHRDLYSIASAADECQYHDRALRNYMIVVLVGINNESR